MNTNFFDLLSRTRDENEPGDPASIQTSLSSPPAKMDEHLEAIATESTRDTFGNHIYLEKQDKLRELGIPIQTSQVCLTGR